MDFFRSHKLIVATIIIQIIALPLILLLVKQKQETQTHAAASTTLFFTPSSSSSSPIQASIGQNVSLDLMLDPGTNLVSFAKIEIDYDPALFTPDPINPVVVNVSTDPNIYTLSTIMEGPVISNGKIQIALSIGSSSLKPISTQTKILTVNLKAIAASNQNSTITIGPNTEILSSYGPDGNGNVLASTPNTVTATIKVASAPTSTPNPTATPTPAPTSTPTPTPSPLPTPTPTTKPTPIPTPIPVPTVGQTNATPTPGNTILSFIGLKLHGIGHGGDNPNPSSIGTLSPLRTTRAITVTLTNGTQVTQNLTGNITYTGSTTGLFDGNITIPNSLVDGPYTVKISTPYYVPQTVPNFFITLSPDTRGTTINVPSIALVAGDVDGDGNLETGDDYNLLMDCYSDLAPAKNCDSTKKAAADISDDGKVNMNDYNLLIRELSVQKGD